MIKPPEEMIERSSHTMTKNKTYLLNADGFMLSLFDLEPFRHTLCYKYPHATLSYDAETRLLKVTSTTSLVDSNEIELDEVMADGLDETTALASALEFGLEEYVAEDWCDDIAYWMKAGGRTATVIFAW